MTTWRKATLVLAMLCGMLAPACSGSPEPEEPGPPIGNPVLPDLVPSPPVDVQTTRMNGRWLVRFSSILVNVGDGDFVLRATRGVRAWRVEQGISYSTSGANFVVIDSPLAWGGDGHEHWHVARVATNRLVQMGRTGQPLRGGGWVDSKVGFCFYDHKKQLDKGPADAVYSRESCGDEDDPRIGMGLSPGWGDNYQFVLPGQNIDISDLADGRYRLWAEADERKRFREVTRDNNVTWVDLELDTRPGGVRTALVVDVGPKPR